MNSLLRKLSLFNLRLLLSTFSSPVRTTTTTTAVAGVTTTTTSPPPLRRFSTTVIRSFRSPAYFFHSPATTTHYFQSPAYFNHSPAYFIRSPAYFNHSPATALRFYTSAQQQSNTTQNNNNVKKLTIECHTDSIKTDLEGFEFGDYMEFVPEMLNKINLASMKNVPPPPPPPQPSIEPSDLALFRKAFFPNIARDIAALICIVLGKLILRELDDDKDNKKKTKKEKVIKLDAIEFDKLVDGFGSIIVVDKSLKITDLF